MSGLNRVMARFMAKRVDGLTGGCPCYQIFTAALIAPNEHGAPGGRIHIEATRYG